MRPATAAARLATLVAVVLGLLAPAVPASAETVYEVHFVPTVGDAVIRVEIQRDPALDPQPVILTYSPYNNLNEAVDGTTADDGLADRYVPQGYARAVADVLGTRGSTGCWDYGGVDEQQSGVDVVNWLSEQTWSNGKVGMIGVSYEGTTANMVAARGDDAPGLKAIVPIAAISRWYGYAYDTGVRYFLNSREPTDEGFDTPLAFDFGFGRTVPAYPTDEGWADALAARTGECGSVEHTERAYDTSPDYTDFWLERDYRKDAESFRAATFVVHGWQDYNVKQVEGTALFDALREDNPGTAKVEGVPFKMLWMTQQPHAGGSGPGYQELLDAFFAQTLKGVDHGLEDLPEVTTRGLSSEGPGEWRTEAKYPAPQTRDVALHLGRKFDTIDGVPSVGPVGTTGEYGWLSPQPQDTGGGWTHASPGTVSEELTLADPLNREILDADGQPIRGHGYYSLFHESAELTQDVRILGSAVLDTWVNTTGGGMHLTPLLVEVLPDGTLNLVERGFANLDYRDGLAQAQPASGWQHARVEFLPQDYTFRKGSRIGLMLQGSNTVWAVPGNPGMVSYAMGPVEGVTDEGATLHLPAIRVKDPARMFGSHTRSNVYKK
jgi:X-Pro dipeptidyl-peptidase